MKLKEFFYLRKDDRKVLLVLIAVIAISTCGVYYLGGRSGKDEVTADSLASEVVKQPYSGTSNKKDEVPIAVGRQKVELFNFDPNTADSITLLRLGLPRWQVRSIYKYRANGGVYRCKEDFAQLRGLTLKKYRELEPYIHIADQFRPASEFIHRPGYHTTASHSVESTEVTSSSQGESGGTPRQRYAKIADGETVDLASMDTLQFRMVPGIGSVTARAIVSRGRRLGGYASVSQLMEVSGFPESALQYFRLSKVDVKKININRLSLDRLRAHPYINFYMARDITEYRHKNGSIHSLEELKIYPTFTDEVIKQLKPYIEL